MKKKNRIRESQESQNLKKEIQKSVEGILPYISPDFYKRYNNLLIITLILSLIPLLTYIIA